MAEIICGQSIFPFGEPVPNHGLNRNPVHGVKIQQTETIVLIERP